MPPDLVVGVVGAGRVGCALARGLLEAGIEVSAVASRSPAATAELAEAVGAQVCAVEDVPERAELVLLSVPDDAIAGVAARLADPARVRRAAVVHCSGAVPVTALDPLAAAGHTVGALHVLQAFPTRATPLRPGVAAAVTAQPPLRLALVALARRLGAAPFNLADGDRARYHGAASLAANTTVTLTAHAVDLLRGCGLDRAAALDALLELLRSTLDGLAAAGLPAGLTGPLVRGDVGTIARHVAALDADPADAATADLYRAGALATLPLVIERGLPPERVAELEATLRGRTRPSPPEVRPSPPEVG